MSAARAAQRRAKATWKKRFRQMDAEAGGLWQTELIRENSPHRRETVIAALHWLRTLQRDEATKPLCLTCDTEFRWPGVLPAAMFFLAPHKSKPENGSISGICRDCAALPDREVIQRALAVWRNSVMSNARIVNPANVHIAGGRA